MDASRTLTRLADLSGLVVLVVDDDHDALDLLGTLLEACNAEVVRAHCAGEAFQKLREHLPDVLVSDIGLPGEDGYSLIERVRALPQAEGGFTPAIALTAYTRDCDRRRAFAAGFWRHMAKPVDVSWLCQEISCLAVAKRGTNQAARLTSDSSLRNERKRA
jgi:CheY-like chemotaxis protein